MKLKGKEMFKKKIEIRMAALERGREYGRGIGEKEQ
jgi:hypothetical protein